MGNCHVVGPNQAMVISGGCCSNGKRIIVGGCGWAWWGVTNVQKLSLNVMTLIPKCENVETKQGVSLNVTGVAQVMVMAEDHMSETRSTDQRDAFLHKALEQFLGKTEEQIRATILQVEFPARANGVDSRRPFASHSGDAHCGGDLSRARNVCAASARRGGPRCCEDGA